MFYDCCLLSIATPMSTCRYMMHSNVFTYIYLLHDRCSTFYRIQPFFLLRRSLSLFVLTCLSERASIKVDRTKDTWAISRRLAIPENHYPYEHNKKIEQMKIHNMRHECILCDSIAGLNFEYICFLSVSLVFWCCRFHLQLPNCLSHIFFVGMWRKPSIS